MLAASMGSSLVAPAIANAAVKFEGVIDIFAGSVRSSGDAAHATKVGSSGMATSWIGLRGSEDLGRGTQANFAAATYFRPSTGEVGRFPGDPTYSRAANIGLSGAFGTLSLGRGLAPNTQPISRFNPFGNSPTFSPLALHLNVPLLNASGWINSLAGDTGWSNQIRYTTPSANGLTVGLHYQFGEAASNNKSNIGANLLYLGNPFSLSAFVQRVEVNNPLDTTGGVVKSIAGLNASRQTAWFIGTSYDFKRIKLFATYDRTAHDIDLHDRTCSVGVAIPADRGEFMAAWAQTRRGGSGISSRQRDTTSLGYTRNLSKRVELYMVVTFDKVSAFASGSSIGAGIQHSF